MFLSNKRISIHSSLRGGFLSSPSPLEGEGGVGGSGIRNLKTIKQYPNKQQLMPEKHSNTPHPNPPPQGGRGLAYRNGFTLIELSIVLLIIGLIVGSVMPAYTGAISTAKYTDTKNKIANITNALNIYYAQNKRLPCPASGSLLNSSATPASTTGSAYGESITGFGLPIYYSASPSTSAGCDVTNTNNAHAVNDGAVATFSPTGTKRYLGSDGTHYIRQGTLPTRALGLSDDMMYDGYGNKFTYAVTEQFTTSAVAGQITINDGNTGATNPPNPIVGYYNGGTAIAGAAFVIVSHGNDGKGAWTQGGMQIACNTSKTADIENCGSYSTAGTTTSTIQSTTPDYVFTAAQFNDFTNGVAAQWFDDAIGWETENAVIGLMPATMRSIRLTASSYNANTISSTANANTLCANDANAGTGYSLCTATQLNTSTNVLPLTSMYPTIGSTAALGAWIDGNNGAGSSAALNCSNWGGGTSGSTLTISSGAWVTSLLSANCNAGTTLPIACCK